MSTNYQASMMASACRLRAAGWSLSGVRRELEKEHGISPSNETLLVWTDLAYAEQRKTKQRKGRTAWRSSTWTFRLPGRGTPEYKEAFVLRLREEQVPRTSIAKVCTVVFGEPWTRDRVCTVLGEKA